MVQTLATSQEKQNTPAVQPVTKPETVMATGSTKKRKPVTSSEPALIAFSDEETESKRYIIKPLKFDGSGSFETFFAHFCNSAEHNKWTEAEKLAWLKASLIKEAGQTLWDSSSEETNSFTKLTQLLKNRFGGSKQTDKFRMELRLRQRKTGESLSSLHQDIRRLMALAHPDVASSSREVIACDYYIDSLNDPDLALKVRERTPKTLDECLFVSQQLEAWSRDASRQRADKGQAQNNSKHVRSAGNEQQSDMDVKLNALSKQLETLTSRRNPKLAKTGKETPVYK